MDAIQTIILSNCFASHTGFVRMREGIQFIRSYAGPRPKHSTQTARSMTNDNIRIISMCRPKYLNDSVLCRYLLTDVLIKERNAKYKKRLLLSYTV